MKTRLASLFLLLVLAGGALAGVPLGFGENNCSMGGRMDMDCCKAALRQKEATKVSQEELLCALNCAQNGTTLPSNIVRVNPPLPTIQPPHPMLAQPLSIPLSVSRATTPAHSPPGSPPTYLRNLTLLI
jgi:hypothetical protein